MAICIMAYMRDSCSGLFAGARHAPKAALAALLFQVITASPDVADSGPAGDLASCRALAGPVSGTMATAVRHPTISADANRAPPRRGRPARERQMRPMLFMMTSW